MAPVPASILRALSLPDASKASLSTANLGSGFTSTGVIRAIVPTADGTDEEERRYFVKTSADGQAAEEMFRGEYESLNAIADSVPGFCPRALAWGPLDAQDSKGKSFFLATEFLELGAGAGGRRTGESLAQRLGNDVLRGHEAAESMAGFMGGVLRAGAAADGAGDVGEAEWEGCGVAGDGGADGGQCGAGAAGGWTSGV
ncbi:hypothetical protein CNMCM8980_004342 [Aspergillus fumigatiaffinis]|uniref:Protein-ribulosamine 3-kinase n=1 Tax=Aspergillus fumigatiaffinis TaxID=340414 RepID=A0A8H4M2G2_9EURO|nr:hypothetical protein CNMCM5878_005743 [Aspergillus fumigatiaffinis]KAF4218111.1 hypothetical protein CNMCM6457_004079 [Aspergillus fumigatiaffinis]KAF4226640.1 hypothetical protein CNMCM6805_004230 [Aspergillus fumigatiaffinis]KAF4233406.1 hypothetical protein CNMCM8980_004342 [Aspergillus fumigatiaffinis]